MQDFYTAVTGSKYVSVEYLLEFLSRIGVIAFIILVGLFAIRYMDKLVALAMDRVMDLDAVDEKTKQWKRLEIRKETLSGILHYTVKFAGYILILLMVLNHVGLDIRPLLATAGVASLAIGFGAQNLVKDVISGFFILLEDQYGNGDVVEIDNNTGTVEHLSLRTTQLRGSDGVLIIRTNGSIVVVKNYTKDWSRIDFKVGVAYNADLEKVFKILKEEGLILRERYPRLILEDPQVLGVESFGASELIVRMWIKTFPGKQWELTRILNRNVKDRFDKEGIEIPFPQRVIWHKGREVEEG